MASAVDKDLAVSGSKVHSETLDRRTSALDVADTAPATSSSRKAQSDDDDDNDVPKDMVSSTLSNSSANAPPYWMNTNAHQRNISNVSAESILPAGAITLQDNDTSEHEDRNNACWAKSVEIFDYTVVNGGATSVGAFVVWTVRVETLNVRFF